MRPVLRRTLTVVAVVLALGLVSAAYLRPEMAMTLANQIWNCF